MTDYFGTFLETAEKPEPGQECVLCKRRMPHPKREDSPATKVRSFRLPADEAESFTDALSRASLIVGITSEHKYPTYKFLDFIADVILADEENWQGAYLRAAEGINPEFREEVA